MNDPRPIRRRQSVNLSLDPELIEDARTLGVNISRACEEGLARAVRSGREDALRREAAAAAPYWTEYLEKHGMPFADLRPF